VSAEQAPPLWAAAPFVLLLASIAVGPIAFRHGWHRHYPKVAFGLGALVVAGYAILRRGELGRVLHAASEYTAFVALIGSLYVVASGVLVTIHAKGTTTANVVFLAVGGALSNLLGTTGAAMLLIRPYLRMNRGHAGLHHVPFFVFVVANVGGTLTPIGDPPLFLGYLRGVPFSWTAETIGVEWVATMALLLGLFAIVDQVHHRTTGREIRGPEKLGFEIAGARSFLFLLGILALVLVQAHPFVRERQPIAGLAIALGMAILAGAAYASTERRVHAANEFSFEPLREVAILFAGIFATMIPALEYLERNAHAIGVEAPQTLYFASGLLSSVLDNAPTYLTFLATAVAQHGLSVDSPDDVRRMLAEPTGAAAVAAISSGAVFFGAMTYIGNGPNFMVKAIAEASGTRVPSFFGYITRWAIPFLLPVLLVVGLVFFPA